MRNSLKRLILLIAALGMWTSSASAVQVSEIIRKIRCPARVNDNKSIQETYSAANAKKCGDSPELLMVEDREFGVRITMMRGVSTMTTNGAVLLGAADFEHVLESAKCGMIDADDTILLLWDPLLKNQRGCDEGSVPKNRPYRQFHLLTGQLCWGGTNLCVSRLDLKGLPLERFDSVVKHFYRSPIENREISQNVRVAPSPVSTFSEKKTLENKRAAIETKNPRKEQLQFPGFIGSAQASESGWSKHSDQHLIDNCKDSRKEKYTLEDLDAAKFLRSEGLDNGNECVQAVYDQFFPKFPQ